MHVETPKLVSILAMSFGALLASLGALMLFGLGLSMEALGAVPLIWCGVVFVLAGRDIRRTHMLLERPRWFFASCLFGIASSAGLYKAILTGDSIGAIGMILMQAIAIYALWRALRRREDVSRYTGVS